MNRGGRERIGRNEKVKERERERERESERKGELFYYKCEVNVKLM